MGDFLFMPDSAALRRLDAALSRRRSTFRTVGLGAAAVLVLLWVYLVEVQPLPGEHALLGWIEHPHPAPVVNAVCEVFTTLGDPRVAVVTVVALTLLARVWWGPRAALIVLAAAGVVVASSLCKLVVGPTPLNQLLPDWFKRGGTFPSGHVAYATSLFGAFALLAWLDRRRGLAAVCAGIVILMGPTRVLAGVHFPSDVIGGYALGVAWLVAVLCVGTTESAKNARWLSGSGTGSRIGA